MASKISTAPPRGMRDVLPDEVERRDLAIQRILTIYRSYGFRRIETPALENLRLLTGSGGGENEKLIFKVLRRGEDLGEALRAGEGDLADLGLRYDLTVPLARYYAANHARLPDPLKAVQIGPVWRADRPQKGRYRQFTQCDIDVLGVASVVVEVELILATAEALRIAFGLDELTVRINDRRILSLIARHAGFAEQAQDGFFIAFDKLDKIGAAGVLGELRQAGHDETAVGRFETLLPTLQKGTMSLAELQTICGATGDEAGAFDWLDAIVRTTNAELPAGARVRFDPTLVRGMGYYTGTIFEVAAPAFSASVAGGGRYDRMIGRLLGRDVPACGFSIGFERLIALLGEQRPPPMSDVDRPGTHRLALLVDGSGNLETALAVARRLRAAGHVVSLELRRRSLGKRLEDLAAHGFTAWAVPEGPGEPAVKLLTSRRPRA